ncbi:RsmB/NOP family class I SAM-dependent RNA methyltransferase [Anaerostipes sp. MSJ-23]|uniref:RsmB/NOP family class I SAM-dependent RNA methyltransferase n=1 Tax=Anaerostipes sp. MSJ-23 TaxID=2841520 RepID=UPI001C0FD739|nr:RsmB/NOP family class I SAM-dependent RNA methyltransferase [Anaerostipes sp. MSJ-23]MBU5460291.1 RsmB/NOP family class I SAM-dependent RNA methyltransferase [Anaerostipes sp. MSJ-23]
MKLPVEFEAKMRKLLGEEFSSYEQHLDDPAYYGIRVNTLKISVADFLKICPFNVTPVPWTDNGFYVSREERPSRHPFYYAGLYYIQEPSAMTPASYLPVEPGDKVLDLCAAPGGKSTELGAKLKGKGILVSNDVSVSRTKALIRNIEMFGIRNSVVLCTEAKYMVPSLHGFFDKILIDAPCSGEGMFRKGSNELKNWEQKGSEPYAKLQREIVDDAVKLLKPGGMLLYSTCTFSPEENEQVIEYMLEHNDDLSLVPMKMCGGFDHGHPEWTLSKREDVKHCIRLWPHKIKGEGHFLALLQKAPGKEEVLSYEKIKTPKLSDETKQFFKDCKMPIDWNHVREHQGKLFYLEEDLPKLEKIRVLRKGLFLGEMKKGRFEPSQSFAVALRPEEFEKYISFDLEDERTIRYLKCETLNVDIHTEGMHLIGTGGFPLGWGKIKKGRMKNKYASSWRWL